MSEIQPSFAHIFAISDPEEKHLELIKWLTITIFEGLPYQTDESFSVTRKTKNFSWMKMLSQGSIHHLETPNGEIGPRIIFKTYENIREGKWLFEVKFQFTDKPKSFSKCEMLKISTLEERAECYRAFMRHGTKEAYQLCVA